MIALKQLATLHRISLCTFSLSISHEYASFLWSVCANKMHRNKAVINYTNSNQKMRLSIDWEWFTQTIAVKREHVVFSFYTIHSFSLWCERSGKIKNKEHTPQFHIWINLIQLFILLFCHFFSLSRFLSCFFPHFIFAFFLNMWINTV